MAMASSKTGIVGSLEGLDVGVIVVYFVVVISTGLWVSFTRSPSVTPLSRRLQISKEWQRQMLYINVQNRSLYAS